MSGNSGADSLEGSDSKLNCPFFVKKGSIYDIQPTYILQTMSTLGNLLNGKWLQFLLKQDNTNKFRFSVNTRVLINLSASHQTLVQAFLSGALFWYFGHLVTSLGVHPCDGRDQNSFWSLPLAERRWLLCAGYFQKGLGHWHMFVITPGSEEKLHYILVLV